IAQAYLHPDLLIAALKSELERSDVTFEPNTSPDLADGLKIAYALELVSTKLEEQQHKLTLQQQEDFQYLQDATRLLAYYWSKDYSKLSQKIVGLKTQTIRKLKKAGSLGSFFEWLVTSNTAAAVAKITPAQQALLPELNDLKTSHERRRDIGKRLSEIGDPRRGIGLDQNGLPDIEWLPVFPGGQVKIKDEDFKVAPFYIARYPITYAQYEAFVKDTDGFNNPEWWRDMPKEYQMQGLYSKNVKPPNYPRDYLSWYQSVAFSRWLYSRLKGAELPNPDNSSKSGWIIGQNAEVRLPTEWEWQWAAQGGREQRQYPWGAWQEGYANTDEAKLNQAVAVGMYPHGAALCKAEDMSGNVWEWCLNEYSSPSAIKLNDSTNSRVLRGGSFRRNALNVASAARYNDSPGIDGNRSGFRLVVFPPILRL
ncbi:MAG: SUMF1/EgtB/PvdO family nonheme iron enzyme, partial [Chloroflexota bacterium]